MNGIDCTEKGQAYGKRAKQAASELVFGREVTLDISYLQAEIDSKETVSGTAVALFLPGK